MADSEGQIGYGSTIGYRVVDSGGAYTTIAELLDITPPKAKVGNVAYGRFDADAPYDDKIPGWRDTDDAEFQFVYVAAQANTIFDLLGTKLEWEITKPDDSTWTFTGFINEFGDETPLKDKMSCMVKIAVSGAPVFTPA